MSGQKGFPFRVWFAFGALMLFGGIILTAGGALAGRLTDTYDPAHPSRDAAAQAPSSAGGVAQPSSTSNLVLSQIYGGGGNSGALYRSDFIEIFNPTSSPVTMNGWSVQYASTTGAFSSLNLTVITGTVQPNSYFLVKEADGATITGTILLPTPDFTGTIAMGATGGKVALVNNSTVLPCGGVGARCWPTQTTTSLIDYIGYGAANDFETAAAPTLTNPTSAVRASGGCTDTENNSADFSTANPPTPRNSASAPNPCLPTPTPGGATNTPTPTNTLTPTATNTPGGGILTGFVTDDTSGAPLKASVQISGTSTFSQSNPLIGGVYTMTVGAGTYTVNLLVSGCYIGQSVPVTISAGGTTHQDFAVERAGPDAAGYTCFENAGRSFITAFNRIMGPTFDEQVVDINGPMPFNYYGTSYLTGTVSSNGFITMGSRATNATFNNVCLPSTALPNGIIAANWDDLENTSDPASGVYTSVTGSSPNRIFTVEWRKVKHFTDATEPYTNTFEVQLQETTGNIYMVYQDVNPTADGRESTLGIENTSGTIAKQVQCSTSFTTLFNFMWAGNSIQFSRGTAPTATATATPGGPTNTTTPTPTQTRLPSTSVVISEFRTRGPNGGFDEFVELYNMSNSPVDISGWMINGSSSCGATVGTRVTINSGEILQPHTHWLAINNSPSGYSGSVPGDQTYTTGVSDGGGFALLDSLGNLIDSVGMCVDTAYYEGAPLAPYTDNSNRSYERLPGGTAGNGQDTDDNSADFAARENAGPQNTCSPAVGSAPVSIGDNFYSPATITVSVGEAVLWTNNGGAQHTTTSVSNVWDSGVMNPGQQFSFTFNSPGTFHYICSIHGTAMSGDIIVVDGCVPSPTPTSTRTPTFTRTATPTRTPTSPPTDTPTVTSTATNTDTPTVTPTDTPAVTPVLVVHLTWQGIAQPNTRNTTETVTATLRLASGPATEYVGYATDASGNFTLPVGSLPSGTYTIRVKGPRNLSNGPGGACNQTVSLTGGLVTNFEAGTMRAGDANSAGGTNFNVVNSTDFTTLKATFGKSIGQPGYDNRADFDNNDVVNSTDFTLLKGNFGQAGCGPVGP